MKIILTVHFETFREKVGNLLGKTRERTLWDKI